VLEVVVVVVVVAVVVVVDPPTTVRVACIHPGWNWHSYLYVPGVVSVTEKLSPLVSVGDAAGVVAPLGTLEKNTLWGAIESWSSHVIVLLTPITIVALAGQKLAPVPAPWGMMIVPETLDIAHPPELVVEVVVEVVLVVLVVVMGVVVVVVVLGVVLELELEPGTKIKYAAPAISITTITAAATAPVPIPLLLCSNFIPLSSPKRGAAVLLLSICGRGVPNRRRGKPRSHSQAGRCTATIPVLRVIPRLTMPQLKRRGNIFPSGWVVTLQVAKHPWRETKAGYTGAGEQGPQA